MNFFDYFENAALVLAQTFIFTKVLYLQFARHTAPVVVGRRRTVSFVFELAAIAGVIAWAAEILLRAFHVRFEFVPAPLQLLLFDSLAVKLLGVGLVTIGLIVDALALISFGDSWRIGIDEEHAGDLVTGGVFAVTRNPIYLAFDLIFLGIFLINGTLIFLIFAVLAIFATHCQIRREEKFLRQQYGASYDEYCKHAPRYLIR